MGANFAQSIGLDVGGISAFMVSWPEEQLHWTTLGELAQCITSHNLTRQTVFLVLPAESCEGAPSRLYAADFSHGYRAAKS